MEKKNTETTNLQAARATGFGKRAAIVARTVMDWNIPIHYILATVGGVQLISAAVLAGYTFPNFPAVDPILMALVTVFAITSFITFTPLISGHLEYLERYLMIKSMGYSDDSGTAYTDLEYKPTKWDLWVPIKICILALLTAATSYSAIVYGIIQTDLALSYQMCTGFFIGFATAALCTLLYSMLDQNPVETDVKRQRNGDPRILLNNYDTNAYQMKEVKRIDFYIISNSDRYRPAYLNMATFVSVTFSATIGGVTGLLLPQVFSAVLEATSSVEIAQLLSILTIAAPMILLMPLVHRITQDIIDGGLEFESF